MRDLDIRIISSGQAEEARFDKNRSIFVAKTNNTTTATPTTTPIIQEKMNHRQQQQRSIIYLQPCFLRTLMTYMVNG